MSSNNDTCCFLIRDPLQNNGEPQAISARSIQDMPNELQEKWSEAIVEELLFNDAEQDYRSLNLILNLDGTIEIMSESSDQDLEADSAHYHPLADVTSALEAYQRSEDLSTPTPTPTNSPNNFNRAESLALLNQAAMTNNIVGSHAALGALTHSCIRFASSLQILIDRFGPALRKRLNDITDWIRAHPYQSASMLIGTSLLTLALAIPLILQTVGFSAMGPVALSIATAWQASIGSVASGSLFAFLQSMAMGGAASSLIWVIGALGGAAIIGAGWALLEDKIRGLTENARGAMGGLMDNAERAIGGFVENVKRVFAKKEDE